MEQKRVKNSDSWLSVRDVAEYLSCSQDVIYDLVRLGMIESARIGVKGRRLIRIRKSSVESFLEERGANAS